MDEEIKKLLDERIEDLIKELKDLPSESEEYAIIVTALTKLHALRAEEIKCETDKADKEDQHKERVKERWWRTALEAAGIILPLGFYAIWMVKGFKFEETGTFVSTTFRSLFSRFKPTK